MQKRYRLLIFVGLIVAIFLYQSKCMKSANDIHSDIYIKGKIIAIVRSNDHDFGLFKILVDSTNFKDTSTPKTLDAIPPFAINKQWAEVYTAIPLNDSVGYIIEVNGPLKLIRVDKPNGQLVSRNDFELIIDPLRIEFIHRHSSIPQVPTAGTSKQ